MNIRSVPLSIFDNGNDVMCITPIQSLFDVRKGDDANGAVEREREREIALIGCYYSNQYLAPYLCYSRFCRLPANPVEKDLQY